MIKISNIAVEGWAAAIRGMRNPYDSWEKSDTDCYALFIKDYENPQCVYPEIGAKDLKLMKDLTEAGDCHAKFARYIIVTMDIAAPLYWWKEYDTYKVGTVADSCSTMHTIMKNPFEKGHFSYDRDGVLSRTMPYVVQALNDLRFQYMHTEDPDEKKALWEAVIQLLPESYMQKRTVLVNYQVLRNMYRWRREHKLDEWHEFCRMVEQLPYSEQLITGKRSTGDESIEHVGYDAAQCGREK